MNLNRAITYRNVPSSSRKAKAVAVVIALAGSLQSDFRSILNQVNNIAGRISDISISIIRSIIILINLQILISGLILILIIS